MRYWTCTYIVLVLGEIGYSSTDIIQGWNQNNTISWLKRRNGELIYLRSARAVEWTRLKAKLFSGRWWWVCVVLFGVYTYYDWPLRAD
jgi:hypothetical protein